MTSHLFVYLSKQLVKDVHTGRLASEERGFDSDQQYKVCLAYLISVIGISMFSMALYGYTFSILIKSIFIFSSLLGLISSQTFISDLQIYDKSIDAKHLFLYFNTLFFIISLLAIIAFKSPILLTFCFIASLTPLAAHFYTNPIIKTFIREQPVNEQELNLLNIMLLDNIKDECSDEYFDTLASPLDLMGLKRAWVPYCSLQKFEQDFKYDFYQQTFEYLKELGVVQGEQLRNCSSISPTEAKGKYEFKKHIQDCRCQLQSMFRVNKSLQRLEVITELPTNGI